jgi:peptidoglycan hydrolase CwlO-like protein
MMKFVALVALLTATPVWAQDIVGLEDCSKATSTDKKIGCLQSNVLFLHQLIRKNQDSAQAELKATRAQLAAADAKAGELRSEIERMKAAVERLEKSIPTK